MAKVKIEFELGECTCEETQRCGLCNLKDLLEDELKERYDALIERECEKGSPYDREMHGRND